MRLEPASSLTMEDITEEDFEQLANEGDEDTALVAEFESVAAEALQDDSDLALAHTTYMEARKKLSDRFGQAVSSSKGFNAGKR